jgi:sRNA-binding carbon storage regulator CsrA
MLVLHRNLDESVIITTPDGYRIEVLFSSFYKDGVQLVFDACPEVTIVRAELEKKQPQIIRKILDKSRHLLVD